MRTTDHKDKAVQLLNELQLISDEKKEAFRNALLPPDKAQRTELDYQCLVKYLPQLKDRSDATAIALEEAVYLQLAEFPQCKWAALGVAAYLDRHKDMGLVTPERLAEVTEALESLVASGRIIVIRRSKYTCYCIKDVPTKITGF
jgi:hypothetical protein